MGSSELHTVLIGAGALGLAVAGLICARTSGGFVCRLVLVGAVALFLLGGVDYLTAARVLRVIDGDTFEARFCPWCPPRSIRIAAIDAPSRGTPAGRAATTALRRLLPVGSRFGMHGDYPESFGRLVVHVTVDRGGGVVDIGQALLASGHAVPWDPHARKRRGNGNQHGNRP